MNYIEKLVEENKMLDLEFAFRKKFYEEGLRLIVTGCTSSLTFCVHDSSLRVVAVADVHSFGLVKRDPETYGIEKDELSNRKISEVELERFWFNFLHKNYDTYKKDFLDYKAKVAESMLND